jgi:polyisoprenoid-binding protein YceI
MNLRSKFSLFALFAVAFAHVATAAVETYVIDPAHSSVAFRTRHLFSKVPGSFGSFKGTITVDRDNLEQSSAEATIEAASVNTSNEKRDNHLRTPEFLDVAKFPTITFKSRSWKKTGQNTLDVTGDLTIRGVTKEVVLKATALGFGAGMQPGSQVSGWEATTTINRRDFGVNGPAMLGNAVGDEVEITINVEAGLKKS